MFGVTCSFKLVASLFGIFSGMISSSSTGLLSTMPLSVVPRLSLRVCFVAATLLTTEPASAQVTHFYGVGAGMSCGEYLQGRQTRTDAEMRVVVEWVRGYMSGFNTEARIQTKGDMPDDPSTLAYLDKYCREHPLDSFVKATWALLRELGGKRRIER